jgi:integrase
MRVRYFEKRGTIWLDFKDSSGARHRVPSGQTTEAAARREAPAIIERVLQAKAQAALVVPTAPDATTVPQTAAVGKTMEEAYKLALRVREQWIKSKDKTTLQQTFDAIVEGHPGLTKDTDVGVLTRDFVRDLRALWLKSPGKRKGTTLSASTINHRLSMLSVLLEVCDAPPHGVKHLSTKGNQRERRITDKEIQAMQTWLMANHERKGALSMADLITLGLELGARQSELLDLKWKDVAAETVTFRDTKNHGARTIPLTVAAARVLERRKGTHKGAPFEDLNQDRAADLWAQAREGIGLGADTLFVFHGLRHECLSRLADNGTDALILKAIAGHESVITTQRYVHNSLAAMRAAMMPGSATLQ